MKIAPTEVEAVLSAANNLNAALKTLLKREAQAENSVEPFVKSLRGVVARNREGELLSYIEKHYPTNDVYFALLASYAFPGVRDSIVATVIDDYADAFNATYEKGKNGINITDPDKFTSTSRQVLTKVKEGLDRAGIPLNNFSIYSLLAVIFEPDVLVEVLEILD